MLNVVRGIRVGPRKTPFYRSNDRFHWVGEVSGLDQDLIRNTEAHAIAWAPEGDRCIKHVSVGVYTHLSGRFQSLPDFDGYPPYEYTQSGILGESEHYLFPFWG